MPTDSGGRRVHIHVGEVVIESEWNGSATAERIAAALPIEASGNYWGGEIYFEIPVSADYEADARDEVDPGTVAFWPAGAYGTSMASDHCLRGIPREVVI